MDNEIKEAEEVIAIQVLAHRYKLNVFDYKKQELEEIVRLLRQVIHSHVYKRESKRGRSK